MRLLPPTYLLLLASVLAGCETARSSAMQRPEHVDSIVSRDEALRRFRVNLPEASTLSGGAPTRDALVRSFVRALEARDTAELSRLLLTRSEFAYLYYPTNPQGLPPYDLAPGLMWDMLDLRSQSSLRHALDERGGQPLKYVGYRCVGNASEEGANTVWGPCLVRRLQAGREEIEERLFGQIIERGGRFKFVSYANRL